MTTLLVMTAGQTDVQLVVNEQRHKLDGNTCGTLHDAIKERSWSVVDAPNGRSRDLIKVLPECDLTLCTPKLDAVLAHFGDALPSSVLIFETNRQDSRDPRLAGEVMELRLRDCGVHEVSRVAFLSGTEQLEDPSNDVDAVVRQTVVAKLSAAIRKQVEQLTINDHVFVATTGGLAAANELINELVRLHAVSGPTVTVLEVPDRERVQGEDRAVEEKFHPAAGCRARWHALSLIEKGNLLGAWGAVSHLEHEPGQNWTQVVKWLANFAASLPLDPPLPMDSDLAVLSHPRMAVRAALRVELALRAGDIPRAVHGTVAFFEAALWDHLGSRLTQSSEKRRLYKVNPTPCDDLVRRGDESLDDRGRPFECAGESDGDHLYRVFDDDVCGIRLAKHYLKQEGLRRFGQAVSFVRHIRNDVAHNEPTPEVMVGATAKMVKTLLWGVEEEEVRFLRQPLAQAVLCGLGVDETERLCERLIAGVGKRLRQAPLL